MFKKYHAPVDHLILAMAALSNGEPKEAQKQLLAAMEDPEALDDALEDLGELNDDAKSDMDMDDEDDLSNEDSDLDDLLDESDLDDMMDDDDDMSMYDNDDSEDDMPGRTKSVSGIVAEARRRALASESMDDDEDDEDEDEDDDDDDDKDEESKKSCVSKVVASVNKRRATNRKGLL